MERDAFSHIRLWCPRPFGTYTQNKPRPAGTVSATGPAPAPPVCSRLADAAGGDGCMLPEDSVSEGDVDVENTPPEPEVSPAPAPQSQTPAPSVSAPTGASTSAAQVEEGRVLLDTWYVIKPGNTKEKIAFFVAHQISGAGQARPSAMKVKGNWATDCSKAKRRRRCSSYDPPTRSAPPTPAPSAERSLEDSTTLSETGQTGPGLHETGLHETDLLSVAEMVALVEQRTALALQGIVGLHGSLPHHHLDQSHASNHQLLRGTVSDPTPVVFVPNPSKTPPDSSSPIQTDQELEEQQESCRVAEAIAHFESQNLENRLNLGHGIDSQKDKDDGVKGAGSGSAPPQPSHSHGEVRIAFRVSNIDSRSQLEPAGRSRCMFMTCGGGSGQSNARSKEKITCDLYQLVSPSSRDPSSLLLAATTAAPKQDGDASTDSNSANGSDSKQEHGAAEKKSRERVTGFHVEVVVTGAVDQCVFYGKDSTENVQEETVCFAVQSSASAPGGEQTDDPPPGQLFFLQRGPDEDLKTANACNSGAGKAVECVNNNNNSGSIGNAENARPESPIVTEECADSSLCRLYRHVSHDFLEIRFQIQRLLEPRQYMVLLPDHIMVNILSYLPTRSLAALKCTCHYFKALIETYGVRAVDSRWNQDPLYRDDPCKQCKRQYERGDVSLCRWHPKPYHHDLPYGRSYWMCCRRTDKDTPGCRVGLHDNNWVQHSAEGQAIRARRDERREEAR